MERADLISDQYLRDIQAMHREGAPWGDDGYKWASDARRMIEQHGDFPTVLDYGCGRKGLAKALEPYPVTSYDPAWGDDGAALEPHDIVLCTDVLEHVEPDKIDNVLAHIRKLAKWRVFLVISLRPARKKLPNGEQAHILLRSSDWWRMRLKKHGFTAQAISESPGRVLIWEGI